METPALPTPTPMARPFLQVRFDCDRLLADLGGDPLELQRDFQTICKERLSYHTIYGWFRRSSIPVERLAQLFAIAEVRTRRRLNLWNYIDATVKGKPT